MKPLHSRDKSTYLAYRIECVDVVQDALFVGADPLQTPKYAWQPAGNLDAVWQTVPRGRSGDRDGASG